MTTTRAVARIIRLHKRSWISLHVLTTMPITPFGYVSLLRSSVLTPTWSCVLLIRSAEPLDTSRRSRTSTLTGRESSYVTCQFVSCQACLIRLTVARDVKARPRQLRQQCCWAFGGRQIWRHQEETGGTLFESRPSLGSEDCAGGRSYFVKHTGSCEAHFLDNWLLSLRECYSSVSSADPFIYNTFFRYLVCHPAK